MSDTGRAGSTATSAGGVALSILCAQQFIMAYDTLGMNVAISTIVEDLDTTLTGMQAAIAMYAVVMAAFNWPPCARAVRLLGEVGTYSQRA